MVLTSTTDPQREYQQFPTCVSDVLRLVNGFFISKAPVALKLLGLCFYFVICFFCAPGQGRVCSHFSAIFLL